MNIQQLQDRLSVVEGYLTRRDNVKSLLPPPSNDEVEKRRNENQGRINALENELAALKGEPPVAPHGGKTQFQREDRQPQPEPMPAPGPTPWNQERKLTWWQKQQRGLL